MIKLSVIIPCYNEEKFLKKCVERVLDIEGKDLSLEVIIVDDQSTDNSVHIAKQLENAYKKVQVIQHHKNMGKGAAIRTGIKKVTGDFVAIQDADLEYDPKDLIKLLIPLKEGRADVVLGSRFMSSDEHRVLYFWHSIGNKFLTFLSNMFTDLNLSDMETCYKIFRSDVIKKIDIKENRFGFEAEIIAKISQMRLRIYEIGISYQGRTYEEGKKIGAKDALRTLYCIIKYNAHKAPVPIQFFIYIFIGGLAALFNLVVFLMLMSTFNNLFIATPIAFFSAAAVNYLLCIFILFKHKAKWNSLTEIILFIFIVCIIGIIDLLTTNYLFKIGLSAGLAKIIATGVGLIFNFLGRKYLVFPEPASGPWKKQIDN